MRRNGASDSLISSTRWHRPSRSHRRWAVSYFNQELFGTPTDLPWGLEIDPPFRPEEYSQFETFHPTFLYESVMNVGLAFFIIWVGNRYPSMRGRLVGIYFLGYGFIRFLMELIRTDTSFRFLGLSRNGWVSIGVMILGALVLWWRRIRVEEDRYILAGTSS